MTTVMRARMFHLARPSSVSLAQQLVVWFVQICVSQIITLSEAADPGLINQDFGVVVRTLAPLLRSLCYLFDNELKTKKVTSEVKRANTRLNHVEEEMSNKVSKEELDASVQAN